MSSQDIADEPRQDLSPSISRSLTEQPNTGSFFNVSDDHGVYDNVTETLAPTKNRSRWRALLEYKHTKVKITYDGV